VEKNKIYKALDDLLEISKTIRISNDFYDVLPVSYKSIQSITFSYLFSKDRFEFCENLLLQSNSLKRIISQFSPFHFSRRHFLLRALFPALSRGILMESGIFLDNGDIRNSGFLSNKWLDGDLEFLSLHDLLIYKICSEYLRKEDKKIFIIKIGEQIKASVIFSKNGAKIITYTDSISEIDSINSIINKRKLEPSSLEYFDELSKFFLEIAKEKKEDLIVDDSCLSLIFGKIKLGQKELLSASSSWIYEYWIDNCEDFTEEMVEDDIRLFSGNVSEIIDDETVKNLLRELYKNLSGLRRYNFSNPAIEEGLEIELKIKEGYNHLVLLIEENQELIHEFLKDSVELKPYLEIKDKKSLIYDLDSMLKFSKTRNYANKFFDKNLIKNQKISSFIEEDGVFYKVIGIKECSDKKNKIEADFAELFSDKKIADKVKSFFNEGRLKNLVIFDHLTNKKVVISEERQVYVDSKELLKLLMNDFLKEKGNLKIDEDIDLKELTSLFSKKVQDQFIGINEEHQKINNTTPDKLAIEQITVSYEKDDNNLNFYFLMKDGTSKQMNSSIKPEYSQIMDDVFCKNLETKITLTTDQHYYFTKKLKDNLKSEIKKKVGLDCNLQDKIFKLIPKTANKEGKKSIQIISKTYPKNS
jgi:hypothetical protein